MVNQDFVTWWVNAAIAQELAQGQSAADVLEEATVHMLTTDGRDAPSTVLANMHACAMELRARGYDC